MKNKLFITTVICLLLSAVVFTVGYAMGNVSRTTTDWKDVGGNIDIEYYLEVSEDSIWIENTQSHRVYGGTYSDLQFLVDKDNL